MAVIGNGMPETAPFRSVRIVQFDESIQFLAGKNLAEVDVTILFEKAQIQHAGNTDR